MKIASSEKKTVDKLVEECNENIDGNEMIYNGNKKVCGSCTIYIVLFVIAFLIMHLFIFTGT